MTNINTWDRIRQWDLVLPPSRPSAYHLKIICNEIQNLNKALPVVVLGSTPEFRDTLFKLGFEQIYVIDSSRSVYSYLSDLRSYSNEENFVLGDWVNVLPQYKNYFGLILSDLTSGNVPYHQQPTFYSAIASALREDGLFIDKFLTHMRPYRLLSDLMRKYADLPVNLLYINYFSCEFLFCSELIGLNQIVDSTLFYTILEHKFENNTLRKFLTESPKITPYGTIWYYGREWSEISNYYYQHLEQISIFEEELSSPYYPNLKIIVTRKKSL